MRRLKIYIPILLFFFLNCVFLPATPRRKRGSSKVERMVGYNTFLHSIVDNTFQLLESREGGCFFVCPSSGGGSRLVFSLCEASRIVLKIDKMRGWPDGGGVDDSEKKSNSSLEQVTIDHSRALNEYWCYLEGADLGYSERENKLVEARAVVLDGIRSRDATLICKGYRQVRWWSDF